MRFRRRPLLRSPERKITHRSVVSNRPLNPCARCRAGKWSYF